MRRHVHTAVLCFCALLLVTGCRFGPAYSPASMSKVGGSVLLRLKPANGQTYTYREEMDADTVNQAYTADTTLTVVIRKLNPKTVGVRITRTKVDVESLDSDLAARQKRSLGKDVGIPIDADLNQNGEIQNAFVNTSDQSQRDSMYEEFVASPGFCSLVYPAERLVVGSRWTAYENYGMVPRMLGMGAEFEAASRVPISYEFKGIEEGHGRTFAVIKYRTDATIESSRTKSAGLHGLMSFSVKGNGTFRVDISNGMLETDEWNTRFTLSMAGIDTTIKLKAKTRLESVK